MKKVNFCAAIDSDFDATLKGLKDALGLSNNAEILKYLVGFYENPFKTELSTNQKAELFIQKELLNPTQKINTHTLKKHFLETQGKDINRNNSKEVLELYKAEIDTHNAKFEK